MEPFSLKDVLIRVHMFIGLLYFISFVFCHILVIDRVFRGDCATRQVYEEGAKEIALSVVNGINCKYNLLCWLSVSHKPLITKQQVNCLYHFVFSASIFAYGQTSSGKTYTMIGITEYTVADIFDYIHRVLKITVVFVHLAVLYFTNILVYRPW